MSSNTGSVPDSRKVESQGGHQPGRPGKVRQFDIDQEKVGKIRNQGNYGLPMVCSCDSHKINNLSTVR